MKRWAPYFGARFILSDLCAILTFVMYKNFQIIFKRLLPAFTIIAVSLCAYMFLRSDLAFQTWQVRNFDDADYRYLAEHFFGIRHDFESYDEKFIQGWGNFLDRVPIREIGVGTAYLLLKGIVVLFQALSLSVSESVMMPWMLKFLLAVCYLIFAGSIQRRYGYLASIISVAILAVPPSQWLLTERLLAEPFLRMCIVLLLSLLLDLESGQKNPAKAILWIGVLLILMVHLRTEWILFSVGVLCVLLWHARRLHWSISARRRIIGFLIAVPLSLSVVHYIGWGTLSPARGAGLQLNLQTKSAYLLELCETAFPRSLPLYCVNSPNEYIDDFFGMYFGPKVTDQELAALDRGVLPYVVSRPLNALQRFIKGTVIATNFPSGLDAKDRPESSRTLIVLLVDVLTWLLLFAGLWKRETRLTCIAALLLWIVPAAGFVVSSYVTRYHRCMAGIPLAMGIVSNMKRWKFFHRRNTG